MQHQVIKAYGLETISWFNNTIVDWGTAGMQYLLDGQTKQLSKYHYRFGNGAITSASGIYVFIYQKLGTKGLLLKNGEILREINRSYYCADVYEYPCAFAEIDNITYLIHCPVAYDQLDLENVETGELITNIPDRIRPDIFHSRLEVSPDGSWLMSKGWVWHPLDLVSVFELKKCINDPRLLDHFDADIRVGKEICTASLIDNTKILLGSSDEEFDGDTIPKMPARHIAVWDLKKRELSAPVPVEVEFGNLFAIDGSYAWDMYKFPKIIEISSGKVVDAMPGSDSGQQRSAIYSGADHPQIVFDRNSGRIAVSGNDVINIFTP